MALGAYEPVSPNQNFVATPLGQVGPLALPRDYATPASPSSEENILITSYDCDTNYVIFSPFVAIGLVINFQILENVLSWRAVLRGAWRDASHD